MWFQHRVNGDLSYTCSSGAYIALLWSELERGRGNITISRGVFLITFSLNMGGCKCVDKRCDEVSISVVGVEVFVSTFASLLISVSYRSRDVCAGC